MSSTQVTSCAGAGQGALGGLFRSKSRLIEPRNNGLSSTMPARTSVPSMQAPAATTLPSQRKRAAWQGADAELNYNSEIVRVSCGMYFTYMR